VELRTDKEGGTITMKMILDLFAGSLTVTVYKDSHITTATATPDSSLAKDDDVALTITPATNYELDEIEVVAGGVTPEYDEDDGWGFVMGEADVVLNVKSKKANNYMVTEETSVNVNDNPIVLHQNSTVQLTKNGVPKGVTAKNGGTVIAMNDAVQNLIDQGILVKL
jgi:hypothetical protein